ncbi:H(+)-transporting two-sector ATPase F(1) alpha subunit, partial [Reticulomyxa filosa]
LLERAGQLNAKAHGGSHTAVCIADKPDDRAQVLFDFLPMFSSHVDVLLNLSERAFSRKITPPVALYPVPFGTPKYQAGYLRELVNNVRSQLHQQMNLERAYREQIELGLHIDPDMQHIINHIYKMEVLFSQQNAVTTSELIILLSAIANNLLKHIHVSKIMLFEDRLLHYFIDNPAKHELIDNIWENIQNMRATDHASDELKEMLQLGFTYFLAENNDLCTPSLNVGEDINWH